MTCCVRSCIAKEVNWISRALCRSRRAYEVKIRNKHVAADATIFPTAIGLGLRFASTSRSAPSRRAKPQSSIRAMWSSAAAGSSSFLRRFLEYWAFRAVLFSLRTNAVAFRAWLSHDSTFALLDRAIPRLRQTAYQNLTMALPDATRCAKSPMESIALSQECSSRFPDFPI